MKEAAEVRASTQRLAAAWLGSTIGTRVEVPDTEAGDVTVIQKRRPRTLEPSEYSLLTLIPVGVQPNGIVIKTFLATK